MKLLMIREVIKSYPTYVDIFQKKTIKLNSEEMDQYLNKMFTII